MTQQNKKHRKTRGAMHRGNVQIKAPIRPETWPPDPNQPTRHPLKEARTARFYMGIILIVAWFTYAYIIYSLYGR